MIYTHVVRNMSKAPESPLDNLLRQTAENKEVEKGVLHSDGNNEKSCGHFDLNPQVRRH